MIGEKLMRENQGNSGHTALFSLFKIVSLLFEFFPDSDATT
jgi:hypothetical protein